MVGPVGHLGQHVLGIGGREVVPALIPLLRTRDRTASENPPRRLTVKTKTYNTSSQSD